jgi:hypothetical protein
MDDAIFNLLTICGIGINFISSIIFFIITTYKNRKLQEYIEVNSGNRDLLQREYDIRKESIKKSEEKSSQLFQLIDQLVTMEKSMDIEKAYNFLMKDIYKVYWENVLFYPEELREIYIKIGNKSIEALVKYKSNAEKYLQITNEINDLYFDYITIFRKLFYYSISNMSKIVQNRFEVIKI